MKKEDEIGPLPEDELRLPETPAVVAEPKQMDEFAGQGGAFVFDGLIKKRVTNPEEKE